jgi:hypothetical protein
VDQKARLTHLLYPNGYTMGVNEEKKAREEEPEEEQEAQQQTSSKLEDNLEWGIYWE